MAKVKDRKSLFLDTIRRAWRAKDENELEGILKEAGDSYDEIGAGDPDEHIHIHAGGTPGGDRRMTDEELEGRLANLEARHAEHDEAIGAIKKHVGIETISGDAEPDEEERKRLEQEQQDAEATKEIEGNLQEEAPAGTTDSAIKSTKDSSLLADSFQETVALAEILVPGIAVPTFDKAADRKITFDAICGLRRNALNLFGATMDGRTMISQVNGGKPLDLAKMACRDVRTLFRAVSGMKKASNNHSQDRGSDGQPAGAKGGIRTPKDLNQRMRDFYKTAN